MRPATDIFQSTRPVRGATPCLFAYIFTDWNFNPRAPCGARPHQNRIASCLSIFQSTRPVRGATADTQTHERHNEFQSTRPVRGATAKVYKITLHTFATKGNF